MPATAIRLRDGETEKVPLHAVRVGDRLRVVEDTIVPVDGRVVAGRAAIDESAVTGESVPVARGDGDSVLGGTIVREGHLTIEATRVGSESAIGRILRAGADKVSLNTSAVERCELITESAERFGSQCIVVAIDARREPSGNGGHGWKVYTHGGRNRTDMDAVDWASQVAGLGRRRTPAAAESTDWACRRPAGTAGLGVSVARRPTACRPLSG